MEKMCWIVYVSPALVDIAKSINITHHDITNVIYSGSPQVIRSQQKMEYKSQWAKEYGRLKRMREYLIYIPLYCAHCRALFWLILACNVIPHCYAIGNITMHMGVRDWCLCCYRICNRQYERICKLRSKWGSTATVQEYIYYWKCT